MEKGKTVDFDFYTEDEMDNNTDDTNSESSDTDEKEYNYVESEPFPIDDYNEWISKQPIITNKQN
jgi:hypothetical protein